MAGHNTAAPGFGQSYDPFAALSKPNDDMNELDFEDTYDGLGDNLDETDDAFNDDTFGGGGGGGAQDTAAFNAPVGRDFDFFNSTAQVSRAMEEEHARFDRQQPAPRTAVPAYPTANHDHSMNYASQAKPVRTGYEKYRDPEPAADLQIDASIWGTAPKKTATPTTATQSWATPPPAAAKKVMSLEEVEAAMRAQAKPAAQQPAAPTQPEYPAQLQPQFSSPQPQIHHQPPPFTRQDNVDYRFQQPGTSAQAAQSPDIRQASQAQTGAHGQPLAILQRPSSKHTHSGPILPHQHQIPSSVTPTQILQNPNRPPGDAVRGGYPTQPMQQMHRSNSSFTRQQSGASHAVQLNSMSEQEKSAFVEAEARRAKRNFKIHVLSKDNGLMTPHDKSFITRIQLQQLVSTTGNPSEFGSDAAFAEDFYYQVHNSLKAAQRPNPNQPLNNFAQTYLFQTGNRQGGMRRHGRGPENHMQRMEQQVQRAVEAAKNKPKNRQLVIEGSLGKISFSNAKTPKPLLNIKRTESGNDVRPGGSKQPGVTDLKVTLRAIESAYAILMKMEDHERTMPPPPEGEPDEAFVQRHLEWRSTADKYNAELWDLLKVQADEPIDGRGIHPFIAFLYYPKGKKVVPRVFRMLSHQQRTTILTCLVVNLDQLDVIQGAQVQSGEPVNLTAGMRDAIDIFSMAVMPCLFNLLNETELPIVTGELGLIIQKQNIDTIARTRIGISMLTMILSRAEIIKENGLATEQDWQQWVTQFNSFFNHLEPTLPNIFPGTVTSGEDVYVWQFLAAIGIGASPDEQQRLVLAVKDRVMDTVALSKTLPADMAQARLNNVNLFMKSIGLDVELLQ